MIYQLCLNYQTTALAVTRSRSWLAGGSFAESLKNLQAFTALIMSHFVIKKERKAPASWSHTYPDGVRLTWTRSALYVRHECDMYCVKDDDVLYTIADILLDSVDPVAQVRYFLEGQKNTDPITEENIFYD